MSWSDGLEPLFDSETMRAGDAWAIGERRVPGVELMLSAGSRLADAAAAMAPRGLITIVSGPGNNGGDGLVAARRLRDAGRDVRMLVLYDSPERLSDDARPQHDALTDPPPEPFSPGALFGSALIVDAILGTGFGGVPREPAAAAIRAINAASVPVLAADIPSGVDASTGEVAGDAVRADATVTFHAGMPGLWVVPGKRLAGRVEVADIDMPPGAPQVGHAFLLGDPVLASLPRRDPASTKFSSGSVLVAGGSSGLTGAPVMAAQAAQRAGAGYVTVAAPASLELAFAARLLEAMFAGLPEREGGLGPEAAGALLERAARASAVVLGPGLGRGEEQSALVREVALAIEAPLVIDADGLNALGTGFAEVLDGRRAPTVLTPHAGELGRLLGIGSSEVDTRRLTCARAAARDARAVVVLKGDDTIVAMPGGDAAISPGDAPGLATAGTGDVLAGLLGALLARGMPVERATCAAVWGHVRAGRIAAERVGADHVIASDVIAALPRALAA